MRLTLRHRTVLEILSRDDLIWDSSAQCYGDALNRLMLYESPLFDDLCAVGLADRSTFLPTEKGWQILRSTWPSWLPEVDEPEHGSG